MRKSDDGKDYKAKYRVMWFDRRNIIFRMR